MINSMSVLIAAMALFLVGCTNNLKDNKQYLSKSEDYDLILEEVVDSTKITVPFAIAFLPSGEMLVTDRPHGKIIKFNLSAGTSTEIKDIPSIVKEGDAGILDLILHPDYATNGWIYYSYVVMTEDSKSTMVVDRGKLMEDRLIVQERLFEVKPADSSIAHFGSRLAIKDGYLFITMGEHYYLRDSAQTLTNHLGKVIRVFEDGRVPSDNPFVNIRGAMPEVWSYGHRNPQGLAFHPITGELWEHEHGPKGGDEINIIKPGLNYGWPVICHGIDYDGKPIGLGIKEKEGMEQPLFYYTPSIAPSGMMFYTGGKYPAWKNNLFIGAMALRHLNRIVCKDNKVVHEERILKGLNRRVRSVAQDPEGYIYVGLDGGQILKIAGAQ